MTTDPAPSPPRKPRRVQMDTRVSPAARDLVVAKAARAGLDAAGGRGEMTRRMLAFALRHMPDDWTPENKLPPLRPRD